MAKAAKPGVSKDSKTGRAPGRRIYHVTACRLTQQNEVLNVADDVASMLHLTILRSVVTLSGGRVPNPAFAQVDGKLWVCQVGPVSS